MVKIFLVFLGAGTGGISRYFIGYIFNNLSKNFNNFPFGTLCVNSLGSFIIGILFKFFLNIDETKSIFLNPLLITGFLGGFTTFSSFSLDFIKMLEKGQIGMAFLYIVLSLVISFLFVFIGYETIK